MGKCTFNDAWLGNEKYSKWLQKDMRSNYEARCTVCNKTFKLGTMGVKALDSHMHSSKHQQNMKNKESVVKVNVITNYSDLSPASTSSHPIANSSACCSSLSTKSAKNTQQPVMLVTTSDTLKAEVLWAIQTINTHHSYNSNDDISPLFKMMFSDSMIAQGFTCGKNKTSYLAKFAIAPYIKQKLVSEVGDQDFVLMFDESLNQTTKNKQLDMHVRFWASDSNGNKQVQSRYLGSKFLGHSTAEDLLINFKACADQLNLRKLLSVSMDGPAVNWKFFNMLQSEHAEQFGGIQLIVVGSCGLHTLHNSFKSGFQMWQMDKLLRALHYLFHNVPARREDYETFTKSSKFPLPFCGHRWVENLPVVERTITIWPNIMKYIDAVMNKKLANPHTSSFDTIAAACKDQFILAKLHFFMTVSETFVPFLTKYQADAPLMPFFIQDLIELLKSILRRFVKKEYMDTLTTAEKLSQFDILNKDILVNHNQIDIGFGAESVLQVLRANNTVSQRAVLEFNMDCQKGLSAICKKMLEKSPLKYPTVRQLRCLDPRQMYKEPDGCMKKMKRLLHQMIHDKHVSNLCEGDAITQEFRNFLDVEARDEMFKSFDVNKTRLDAFLYQKVSHAYPHLWKIVCKLLLLSHGQAVVERGFSINKEVEIHNMKEDTIVAHRLVCDYVSLCGGIKNVTITKELLNLAATARTRYTAYLEEEKKKKKQIW